MMRYILALFLALVSMQVIAEQASVPGLQLAQAPIKSHDMASIKRGAKFFAANCMSCHTLVYMRYNKLAQEAGITYDKMPINVKSWPYGVTPPDLSLEADVRGVNWIYTYLHSFYQDSTRPTGSNNLLVPNSSMPDIVGPYQGEQVFVPNPGARTELFGEIQWYDVLKQTKQGSMSPEEFDATIADLVNFLAYSAAPYQAEQHKIGWWVLGFLFIFFFFMYALKKEYWKDVKKHK